MSNRFKIFSVKQRLPKVAYNRIKLCKKILEEVMIEVHD